MADPQFPNVPPFPGVPPLARSSVNDSAPVLGEMTSDAPAVTSAFAGASNARWGIYKNDGTTAALVADTVLSVDFDKEFQVPTYPMEQGSFQSYNKVARPREMSVKLAFAGSKSDRERFITQAEAIVADTALYAVVQPEKSYMNMNFVRMRYDRDAVSGPQLLILELWGQEIRLTASSKFSNTQNPPDADPANQGTVQTQPPTASQSAQMTPPQ